MDFAWAQFEPLRDAFEAISYEWSDGTVPQRQPDGVTYLCKALVGEVDPVLRVKMGAFAHQLNSTLDNIAWAFAILKKQEPGKVSFPITRSPAEFERWGWVQLLGKDAPCVKVVEALQPYNRPEGRCLLTLHALWNHDKHRAPAVLAVIPTGARFILDANGPRPLSVRGFFPRGGKSVHNDQVITRIVMAKPADDPPKGGVILSPALDNRRGALRERMLPHALFEMYRYVREEVVPPLVGLL
jgi:hypothetical protein